MARLGRFRERETGFEPATSYLEEYGADRIWADLAGFHRSSSEAAAC
jgi:hypothetical protein